MNERPTVVVFGGTGYVGTALVRAFTDAHWNAIATSRTHPNTSLTCDIASADSVNHLINHVLREYGSIDAVVHAASPRLERVKPERVTSDAHMRIAADGTKHILDAAMHHTIPVAVIVTSQAAAGDPERLTMGSYPEAKRAQEDLAASYAERATETRVFTVAPGFLPGGLNADLPAALLEAFAKRGDGGTNSPEEIAHTIVNIATDRARYPLSGRVHPIDGSYAPF